MYANWQKGMVLSMKGRNAKKYEKECEKLKKEVLKRRAEISERHKNDPPVKGMGLSPEAQELNEVSKYFSQEVKRLKTKYGME